jgi:hypothetical protein
MVTATLLCCHARQPDFLARMVRVHSRYPWVREILLLDTTINAVCRRQDKILSAGLAFGHGFDEEPEAGGFNEIAARNTLFELAKRYAAPSDWHLAIDADEIFHPDFDQVLQRALDEDLQAVGVECWPILNGSHHLFDARRLFRIDDQLLYDPHLRAFRPSLDVAYVPAPKAHQYANCTQHCRPGGIAESDRKYFPGFYHFHAKAWSYRPEQLRQLPERDCLPDSWLSLETV